MLFYAIYNPVESHINGFTPLLFEDVAGNPSGAEIIGDDGSWKLRSAEVDESSADGGGFAGVEEEGAKLCFAG